MPDFAKMMLSLVFLPSVDAILSADGACNGVKTAYSSLQCCSSSTAAPPSLDASLQAAKTGRDALAAVSVLPFKGKTCVDSGSSTSTFNIGVGDAKKYHDFWKLPDGSGNSPVLATYPWLNMSKFYARKASCPAENMIYLWLQEEFESTLAKPSVCDPVAEAFSKFTRTAYDMEYEANVRPDLVSGTLACYMFPILGPPYSNVLPSYCSTPRDVEILTRPTILDPTAVRRFVQGVMAGPQIPNPYSSQYLIFTQLEQGLAMMHGSFAYAETAKKWPLVSSYPDTICGTYTGPSKTGCEFSGMQLVNIPNSVEVCMYKDYTATPGVNEVSGFQFFATMWYCGVAPGAVLGEAMGVGRS